MGKIFSMHSTDDGKVHYPVALVPAERKVCKRRSWTLEEKLAIIAEVETSGDPVAVVARRHDMNANHLFNWIDRARAGTLDRKRGRKSNGEAKEHQQSRASDNTEQEFIDLGVFTREEMAHALGGGESLMEVELPGGICMRVPLSIEPELLMRSVRALKAA